VAGSTLKVSFYPEDAGMLDVVGFDPATPQVIADFGSAT
jgi:hypothetical protein